MASSGSLVVVGTGIQIVGHTTPEARTAIQRAEKVFYAVADDATAKWLKTLNATAESLFHLYARGKERAETYREMVEVVLGAVRDGLSVCLVLYGHPGVYVDASHEAIRQARAAGYPARMLPGISSLDCLFADLGIDPGDGCQSYEATSFLLAPRRFDVTVALVLCQIGVIGKTSYVEERTSRAQGLVILAEVLSGHYGAEHEIVIYRSALFPGFDPTVKRMPLSALGSAEVETMSTMLVPPKGRAPIDAEMAERLRTMTA